MAQLDNVGNDLGIFPVGLVWRILLQLFDALGVHRVDLNQPDPFLGSQIVHQGLCVGTGGFETDNHIVRRIRLDGPGDLSPKLSKTPAIVEKLKRFDFTASHKSQISHIEGFPDVYGHDEGFPIDCPSNLCCNSSHGYTPFFGLRFNQLANWLKSRKSIAYFFRRPKSFLQYSKLSSRSLMQYSG